MVKSGDIVKIKWLDTSCLNEDIIATDGLKLMPELVITYGKVISVSRDILRIIGEENSDKEHHMYRSVSAIPTVIIKSVKKLNEGEELWDFTGKTEPKMKKETENEDAMEQESKTTTS